MIELRQVRQRHLHHTHHGRLLFHRQRPRHVPVILRALADTLENRLDIKTGFGALLLDDPLHGLDRMLLQQLQDADVLLGAATGTVLPL